MKAFQLVSWLMLSFATLKAQQICSSFERNPLVLTEKEDFTNLHTGNGFKLTFDVVGATPPEQNILLIDIGRLFCRFEFCAGSTEICIAQAYSCSLDHRHPIIRQLPKYQELSDQHNFTLEIKYPGNNEQLIVRLDKFSPSTFPSASGNQSPGDVSNVTIKTTPNLSVENLEITIALVDVTKSKVTRVNTEVNPDGSLVDAFLFSTFDGCGLGYRSGGFLEQIKATFVDEEANVTLSGVVLDNGDGTYKIAIPATAIPGTFTVNVSFCIEDDCFFDTLEDETINTSVATIRGGLGFTALILLVAATSIIN